MISSLLGLCSSLNVRDQVSHTYKTTIKITFLHIQIKQKNKKNRLSGPYVTEEAFDPSVLDRVHINTHCTMGHTYPVSYIAYYAVGEAWQMIRNMMKLDRQSWSKEIWTHGGRVDDSAAFYFGFAKDSWNCVQVTKYIVTALVICNLQ
jgi:hypothetical protein